jgi:hypothetical protein
MCAVDYVYFLVCGREAMMSPEEKKQFYADIPMFLHPFPHVFVFHQQMQAMKAQQQAQQQGGPMAQMRSLMANEETRTKVCIYVTQEYVPATVV